MFAISSEAELVFHLSVTTHCHIRNRGVVYTIFSREHLIEGTLKKH